MVMVDNPETKQPEIIVRFANFKTEEEAIQFAQYFKSLPEYTEYMQPLDEKVTLH
tara:strand:+ start:431 stop:595 length:165 start_codon:yes stop_codon:yes gene_type:complete